jgi:hypothetical protein
VPSNPWSRALKKRKPSLKGLAKNNGHKPKPSLRALVTTEPPVMERPYQEPKPRVKEDFRLGGVLFSGAQITGQQTAGYREGIFRPIGTVDITNGDQTYTMHNRHGSWMHDVWNGNGAMAEPARVAEWLGIDMHHVDISRALSRRFEAELKKHGTPTVHQQHARSEAQAVAARKHPAKPAPKKLTLKGLKKK